MNTRSPEVIVCESKKRYADEFLARIAAHEFCQKNTQGIEVMYIYRCKNCGKYHISKSGYNSNYKVTAEKMFD